MLGLWRQIQANRSIYFLEEDTLDDVRDADFDEDIPIVEDLGKNQRLVVRAPQKPKKPASNRGVIERDNEIADIYEERQRLMKQDVRNYAKINPRPIVSPAQPPAIDDANLDPDDPEDLPDDSPKPRGRAAEGHLDMDEDLPPAKPLLIPNAKNRIKLQPIHMNPV